MNTAFIIFGFLAISQLVFMGVYNVVYFRRHTVGLLLALLSICLISYVGLSIPSITIQSPLAIYLLARLSFATPAVLWIIAHMMFVDDHKIPLIAWILLIGYQLFRAITALLFIFVFPDADSIRLSLRDLTSIFIICFSFHAIILAVRGIGSDLIEGRRGLRILFSVGLGLTVAVSEGLVFLADFMDEEGREKFISTALLIRYILIFIFALTVNIWTSNSHNDLPLVVAVQPSEECTEFNRRPIRNPAVSALVMKIDQAMNEERLYTESDMTIGILAKRLSTQEYILRRTINQELGYKNFNQFLAKYRIEEASKKLKNINNFDSISTIAFDVGYASLTSFNKAFKNINGTTPSRYRNVYLAGSN